MKSEIKLQFRSVINRSAREVFGWYLRPRMIERWVPPWEKIKRLYVEGRPDQVGSKIIIATSILCLFPLRLTLEYSDFVPDESFSLDLKKGTLKSFHYDTQIIPQYEHSSEIVDRFRFLTSLPGWLSSLVSNSLKKRIYLSLKYKHELIIQDVGLLQKYPFEKPLRILITGSHGLIGKSLTYFLEFAGHDIWRLVRKKTNEEKSIIWDPMIIAPNPQDFEDFDVVIHLAGENVATGRWTKRKKERILKSRQEETRKLVEVLMQLKNPPKTFISASAVGYYGSPGSQIIPEETSPGKGMFISYVCEKWEEASQSLKDRGVRVVNARFGLVLSAAGGVLKKLIYQFKWGMGGKIGSGEQYISWIAIDDVVGALYHIIMTPSLKGAVNVVAPHSVSNDFFSKKLGERLNRWLGPPLPEFVIRLLLGQMGEELLLTSIRAEPKRLLETGYNFQYPKLCQAFEHVI